MGGSPFSASTPAMVDCVEFAWPGGGGIGVLMVEETPSVTDAVITVSRVTCDDCHSLCGGVASTDFFTSVGGGVGVCAYATTTTSTSVRVLNSSFHDCCSDYGAYRV